jgi:Tfp pilus assembly protein FimT
MHNNERIRFHCGNRLNHLLDQTSLYSKFLSDKIPVRPSSVSLLPSSSSSSSSSSSRASDGAAEVAARVASAKKHAVDERAKKKKSKKKKDDDNDKDDEEDEDNDNATNKDSKQVDSPVVIDRVARIHKLMQVSVCTHEHALTFPSLELLLP